MYQINDRVTLKTFLGVCRPKNLDCDEENYWLLIGKHGVILDVNEREKQVLIRFDDNLDDIGLINHNKVKNSLWIYKSDIEKCIK